MPYLRGAKQNVRVVFSAPLKVKSMGRKVNEQSLRNGANEDTCGARHVGKFVDCQHTVVSTNPLRANVHSFVRQAKRAAKKMKQEGKFLQPDDSA